MARLERGSSDKDRLTVRQFAYAYLGKRQYCSATRS